MSKMGDCRIWITEKVMATDPEMKWEEASDFVDIMLDRQPELEKKFIQMYLEEVRKDV